MNSKLILVASLVALGFVGYGYSQTVVSKDGVPSGAGPRIAIESKEFNFGEVAFGEVVEQTFEVKNVGGEVLKIDRVSTSCGCTKAKVDKEEIAPGETAELLVTYDSGAMGRRLIGKTVERFVYIRSNDSTEPQVEMRIEAEVIPND